MRQGTTPKHTFTIPFDTSVARKVRVIYAQDDIVKILKKEADCELTGNKIVTRLTQEETFRLNPYQKTNIQVRVFTRDGDSFVSKIVTVKTEQCLDKEVL